MRLVRFGERGAETPGVLDRNGALRDLSGIVPDVTGETLDAASLAALRALDPLALPRADPASRLGPCVSAVGKIACVGLNYAVHAAESGVAVPKEPVIFLKATSAINGPNDDVILPKGSRKTDWEVELAVVIGARACRVDEARAMDHVAGFCILNDISDRELQLERGGQWALGKSCDTFAPLGPWLVTRDEVRDPQGLRLALAVNGRQFQCDSTAHMLFKIPFLVSYVSQFMTLHPGDVVSTGTPPGVGMGQKPPIYLRAGDVMDLEIEGLGRQRQRVVAFETQPSAN